MSAPTEPSDWLLKLSSAGYTEPETESEPVPLSAQIAAGGWRETRRPEPANDPRPGSNLCRVTWAYGEPEETTIYAVGSDELFRFCWGSCLYQRGGSIPAEAHGETILDAKEAVAWIRARYAEGNRRIVAERAARCNPDFAPSVLADMKWSPWMVSHSHRSGRWFVSRMTMPYGEQSLSEHARTSSGRARFFYDKVKAVAFAAELNRAEGRSTQGDAQ